MNIAIILHKITNLGLGSITFELKKQILFFLLASDKKISFENFRYPKLLIIERT
jgi:hypothetical protein